MSNINMNVNSDDSFDNLSNEDLLRRFDEEINKTPIMAACIEAGGYVPDGSPTTYWENRAAIAEGAIERLFAVVSHYVPAAADDCKQVVDTWNHIRGSIHAEYFGGSNDGQ